jgi:ribose-phosphate pyrophosphokinase
MPYYAYGRSDKKDQPRVPITARLLANLIETAGADRVVTVDLHAGQIQGFFNIPLDELTALFEISQYYLEKNMDNVVVVATDVGASKRARNVAQNLNVPLAIVEKRRTGNDGDSQVLNVIGDVEGKRALIIDDEILTASTIVNSAHALRERGVIEVHAACTHPVLSERGVENLRSSPIKELVVTDTVPLSQEQRLSIIKVLSIAGLIGEAISRIHTGRSVGELFQIETGKADPELAEIKQAEERTAT